MNQTELVGRCTCGSCRYTLLREPLFVHCCHCTWCQRETGSAFVLNATIEASAVRVDQGQPYIQNTPSDSGDGQAIVRCPDCQVALWSYYGSARQKIAFVRVGTLEDPSRCPPDVHIFTATKQPWVNLTGDTPVMNEYYERELLWPKEALARRESALRS